MRYERRQAGSLTDLRQNAPQWQQRAESGRRGTKRPRGMSTPLLPVRIYPRGLVFIDPRVQKRVRDRQHRGADKDAEKTKRKQSADDPGKDQQHWQVGPASDQYRAQ